MKIARTQTFRLVALAIAILAMVLLVVGVSQVELEPGMPFERIWQFLLNQLGPGGLMAPPPAMPGAGEALINVLRIFFLVALVLFPIAVVMVIIDPELRKRVLKSALRLLLLFIVLGLFLQNRGEEFGVELPALESGPAGEDLAPAEPITSDEFVPGELPSWLVSGLSLALGVVIAIVIVTIVNQVRQSRRPEWSALEDIERQARETLKEIEGGEDLRDTILRCYAEMTRIVREQRGVRRERAVTAREFTDYLIQANLPSQPVYRLTRLFEKARYGSGTATPQDEEEAIASLQAIADACRSAA